MPEGFCPDVRVVSQLVMTDDSALEMHDLYGIEEAEDTLCTVCLSEPKDIIPLPCRHFCICHECFEHVQGKCPVCRAEILSFMRFASEEAAAADGKPGDADADGADAGPDSENAAADGNVPGGMRARGARSPDA